MLCGLGNYLGYVVMLLIFQVELAVDKIKHKHALIFRRCHYCKRVATTKCYFHSEKLCEEHSLISGVAHEYREFLRKYPEIEGFCMDSIDRLRDLKKRYDNALWDHVDIAIMMEQKSAVAPEDTDPDVLVKLAQLKRGGNRGW